MLLLATHVLEAGERGFMKFRYGVEWGIGSTILSGTKCSYIADEGFLVESEELKFLCHMNGCITGFLGMEVMDRLGFRVYSGYMGLTKRERMIPLTMRAAWNFNGFSSRTSSSMFVDAGAGFRKDAKVSFLGRTGYSYSCRLTEKTALELNAAALVSCSHPDVNAKYTGGTVEKENLGLSRSWNAGLLFTIGLVF